LLEFCELNRHRIGEGLDLDELSFQQLRTLEEDMVASIGKIRERKVKKFTLASVK